MTHDAFYVDAEGNYLYNSDAESISHEVIREYSLSEILRKCFVYRPPNVSGDKLGVINTLCVRRDAVSDCFPLPSDLGLAVDGALFFTAARASMIYFPEKLSAYRHHGNNSFVSDPSSLKYQHLLFDWLREIPQKDADGNRRMLRALALESEAHSASLQPTGSAQGAFKATLLIPILVGLRLIPNWKHFGLPAAAFFGWRRLRHALSRITASQ